MASFSQSLTGGLSFTGSISKKTARLLYGWLSNDRTDYALYFGSQIADKVLGTINSPAVNTTSISIAVWFREPNVGTGSSALSQGLIGYKFWRLHVRGGTLNFRFDESVAHTSTITVPNDLKPHLAVGTYSYTGGTNSTIIAYLDGVAATTTNSTVLPTTQYNGGWGLAAGSTGSSWYNGALERALIYHRVLSGAEITSLYQGTIPSGPYADFELQEGSGTSLADSSGNGQPNATISGNVSWGTGFVATPNESLTRTTNKVLSATLSLAGLLVSIAAHLLILIAALSFSGNISKNTRKLLSATLSFTGTISKSIFYLLTASLSFTGNLIKRTARALVTSALSFTGSLLTGAAHVRTLTAALFFNGSIIPAYSQTANAINGGTTSSVSVTMGSNVTQGNLVVLSVAVQDDRDNSVLSITDSLGNTYAKATSFHNHVGSIAGNEIWYAISQGSGPDTITVNAAGISYVATVAQEFSGIDTANPLDQASSSYGSATGSIGSAVVTTTQPNELIFGALTLSYTSSSTISTGGSFSNLDQNRTVSTNEVAAESELGASAGGYQAVFNSSILDPSAFYTVSIATFRPAKPKVLTKQTNRAVAAALSFTGSISKKTGFLLAAAVSFTGNVTKKVARVLTAAVRFTGAFIGGSLHKLTLTASLSFTTAITRYFHKAFSASLGFTGGWSGVKSLFKTATGVPKKLYLNLKSNQVYVRLTTSKPRRK